MLGYTHPNGQPQAPGLHVSYEGSEDILPGYAMCLDEDNATAAKRTNVAEKPSITNLADLAGVVVGGFSPKAGPNRPSVLPPTAGVLRGVQVRTHANVAVGDLLAPVPGEWTFGKAVCGRPVFRATEAKDGSSSPALVTGDWGFNFARMDLDESNKIIRFHDRFDGSKVPSTTADRGTYLLTGSNAAAVFADQAGGGLELQSTSSNQANLTLNGEAFTLGDGKALFFRCRFKLPTVNTADRYFIGLSITDTAFIASKATDYIGLDVGADGDADFDYVKDGSGGLVSVDVATLVADTEYEFAFHVENGVVRIFFGTPGNMAQIAHTTTATEIPDDELLTFLAEGKSTTGVDPLLLELEIVNYYG